MPNDLAEHLALAPQSDRVFHGQCLEASPGRAFGGHVFALALHAAQLTVAGDRPIHSAHARFLRPVDPTMPLVCAVDDSSESRRFSRRRVVGEQNGKAMVELSAAFALRRETDDFQQPAPDVALPESLTSDRIRLVEIRQVEGNAIHEGRLSEPSRQRFWMRTTDELPDDPLVHNAALGYMSDLQLLWVCLSANGIDVARRHETATLEHSLWFHRPARADQWLLFDQQSVSTAGGLGMSSGSIYTRNGALSASVVTIGSMP